MSSRFLEWPHQGGVADGHTDGGASKPDVFRKEEEWNGLDEGGHSTYIQAYIGGEGLWGSILWESEAWGRGSWQGKEEESGVICDNMHGPRGHYTKWDKTEMDKHLTISLVCRV